MSNPTQAQKDEAVRLYQSTRLGVRQCAVQAGVSQPALYEELRRRGIPRRSDAPSAPSSARDGARTPAEAGASSARSTPAERSESAETRANVINEEPDVYREETPDKALIWEPPATGPSASSSARDGARTPAAPQLPAATAPSASSSAIAPVSDVLKPINCPKCFERLLLEPAEQVPGAAVQCPKCRRKLVIEKEDL